MTVINYANVYYGYYDVLIMTVLNINNDGNKY